MAVYCSSQSTSEKEGGRGCQNGQKKEKGRTISQTFENVDSAYEHSVLVMSCGVNDLVHAALRAKRCH